MAGESVNELLRQLTGQSGEDERQTYARWASLAITGDESLEQLVRRKLVINGRSAQIKDNLVSTLLAGGAVGETPEEMLLKTGLVGWS